ncbi:MAG: UDP-N-acetylmuramoyl-L-alanine--D-glutamate ligase [Alphaproteobacteria bacterium]|nr:UDP-N-acetylmuramoyl-L-alanine--D-glutamate ligase [Alphaproteobacteria bacterium]
MIDCAAYVQTLQNRPVAVFGLARSGLASVEALIKAGAQVIAWDDKEESREAALSLGAQVTPLGEALLKSCAALILAPGVPLHFPQAHPIVKAARAAQCEIIGDLEILHRLNHGRKTVGITGTNGKSTTTALIGHILKENGTPCAIGGNLGQAVLSLEMPPQNGSFVLEISSYQMDLCPTFKPDIAILLNITPDHLDRHGDMAGYTAAKMRIFSDDPAQVQIKYPGIDERVRGCTNMKGDHNLQNASAALLACEALGLKEADIIAAIKTFPGLAHRQYHVRTIAGVDYINDSKATNAQAAAKALGAYDDIYWIAGGQAKDGGLQGLEEYMPHIRHAFLIGEAAEGFAGWLTAHNVPHSIETTLDNAVHAAHEAAQKAGKGTVLLSPACASWDQFKSFERRGDQFTELVNNLVAS